MGNKCTKWIHFKCGTGFFREGADMDIIISLQFIESGSVGLVIHKLKGARNIFPFRFIRIITSLYMASFALIFPNKTPDRVHIIDNYDACVGVLSNCYV